LVSFTSLSSLENAVFSVVPDVTEQSAIKPTFFHALNESRCAMNSIIDVFKKELLKSTSYFSKYQKIIKNNSSKDYLLKFLYSTVDEVRLFMSNKYSDTILSAMGVPELSYFRRTVLKKEITNDIDFLRQRDHGAHTLYNYLLGWLLFSKNEFIRECLLSEFEKRHPIGKEN
jgi:hypothetical protein